MSVSDFLTARADEILHTAVDGMSARRLESYERLGRDESTRRVRALLDLVIDSARTRDLVPILAHAERVGNERYRSGFEFVEVQSAFNLLEEALWRTLLSSYPQSGLAEALGLISTVLGAAKDKLASTYVSLATGSHVPSLDLNALFSGTQNTGGGVRD